MMLTDGSTTFFHLKCITMQIAPLPNGFSTSATHKPSLGLYDLHRESREPLPSVAATFLDFRRIHKVPPQLYRPNLPSEAKAQRRVWVAWFNLEGNGSCDTFCILKMTVQNSIGFAFEISKAPKLNFIYLFSFRAI